MLLSVKLFPEELLGNIIGIETSGSNNSNTTITTIIAEQAELDTLNNQFLKTELKKKISWQMLTDEKPTKAFIDLAKRKHGYSNIIKNNIPNPI